MDVKSWLMIIYDHHQYRYDYGMATNINTDYNMRKAYILPPYKQYSERGVKSRCEICQCKFQVMVKQEHQCKRCLRAICQTCGPSRQKIFKSDGSSAMHRNCIYCLKQHENLVSMIDAYNLCFGNQSRFVEGWARKLNKEKFSDEKIMEQYSQQERFTNENTIKFKSQSDRIFAELFQSYNYSLRHFIGLMTQSIDREKQKRDLYTRKKIQRVLHAVYAYLKDLPYINELIYLVAFILCFSNESYTFFIVTRLIQKVYPQYLKIYKMNRDINIVSSQLKVLIDMYKLLSGKINQQEIEALGQFVECRFTYLIKNFTLNLCSVSNSFYIIDQTLKNGTYVSFYKGLISLIFNCRELICNYSAPQKIQSYILRDVNIQDLKSSMLKFQKLNAKFQAEHQFFDSAQHRKLHEKYRQIQSLYQKSDENLKAKDILLQSIVKDYEVAKAKMGIMDAKVIQLQEQLLKYSDKVPKLQDFERMSELNKILTKKNELKDEEMKRLRKGIEQLEKERHVKESLYNVYQKLQKQYLQELTRLKTENQIYQIQNQAKQIDFNTSVIQQKMEAKNRMIVDLQEKNRNLEAQIEFYKKKSQQQQYFNTSLSLINHNSNNSKSAINQSSRRDNITLLNLIPSISLPTPQQKDNFKKHMDISKQLIDKLKSQKAQMQETLTKQQATLAYLRQKTQNQQKRLEIKDEIDYFINQIPEEQSYYSNMNELERLIIKESNPIKKSIMENVLSSHQKCIHEVRYRAIDAKLKENKIKLIQSKDQHKDVVFSILQLATAIQRKNKEKGIQDLVEIFEEEKDLPKLQKTIMRKEQCKVM